MDAAERAYVRRLKAAPTDIPPGSLVEIIEKHTDIPVGTQGYVVDGPLTDRYDWPVYVVDWVDDGDLEPEDFMDGRHVAGAFFKVIAPPVEFQSVTDVERFLNG